LKKKNLISVGWITPQNYTLVNYRLKGAKGVVCGPKGAQLVDNRVLIKLRECYLFLPSPIHACPCHGPWATS